MGILVVLWLLLGAYCVSQLPHPAQPSTLTAEVTQSSQGPSRLPLVMQEVGWPFDSHTMITLVV
jgi:hypothetical protein